MISSNQVNQARLTGIARSSPTLCCRPNPVFSPYSCFIPWTAFSIPTRKECQEITLICKKYKAPLSPCWHKVHTENTKHLFLWEGFWPRAVDFLFYSGWGDHSAFSKDLSTNIFLNWNVAVLTTMGRRNMSDETTLNPEFISVFTTV